MVGGWGMQGCSWGDAGVPSGLGGGQGGSPGCRERGKVREPPVPAGSLCALPACARSPAGRGLRRGRGRAGGGRRNPTPGLLLPSPGRNVCTYPGHLNPAAAG